MFGSVFRLVPKEGKKQALADFMARGQQERDAAHIRGFVASHLFDAGDDMWVVAIFESEQAYRANADDPAQDTWYRTMRDMLQSDPEWHDGPIVASWLK